MNFESGTGPGLCGHFCGFSACAEHIVIERQSSSCLAAYRRCPDCGQTRHNKGYDDLSLRTVFGKLTIKSPRFHHCDCQPRETKTFSPLAELLPEHTTPELLFLENEMGFADEL